jgi:hypothetical protein
LITFGVHLELKSIVRLNAIAMKIFSFSVTLLLISFSISAQTTLNSGNWSDPTVWSSGTVPTSTSGPVYTSQPITIDQNISITTGTWYPGYNGTTTTNTNSTDQTGGTAYTLTMNNGGTNNASQCILDVKSGTVTFEGLGDFTAANVTVEAGATLILGGMTVNNKCVINVQGTLIINGDLTNSNSSGSFSVGGIVLIYGKYITNNGNLSVTGGGDVFSTGSMNNQGSSTMFGSSNDCATGPCSGRNLCNYSNTIASDQVLCSGSTPANLTGTVTGTTPTTIQWQGASTLTGFNVYGFQTGSDGCSGCDITSPTGSNLTYSPPSVSTGGVSTRFYRLYINDGTCASYSFPVQVLTLSSGGWLGFSSDWNTASNWCANSVPTSSTPVYIYPFPSSLGRSMPVIGTADANAKNIYISGSITGSSSAALTLNAGFKLSIFGVTATAPSLFSFTNNGTFTSATTGTVRLAGASTSSPTLHTLGGTSGTNFGNLEIANSTGDIQSVLLKNNNINVAGTLTLTSGLVNLNGFTVQVGSSAGSPGAISYTSGWIYGGYIQRWFPTSSVTVGSAASLFPIGSSSDYRPFYVGNSGLTSGGTIKISHSSTVGSTAVAFTDDVAIQVVSNSFWTLTTANGLGTGNFNLRTEGTGFGTVGAVTDLRMTKASSKASGSPGTNGGTTTNPQVNRTGINTASGGVLPNSYYWGSINSIQTPLPVSFIDFVGEGANGQTFLKWSTASETNNEYFSVYRSSDGEVFNLIGKVKGQGTSNDLHEYSLVDFTPVVGVNYYRLSQTDLDGKTTILKTISVRIDNISNTAKIYPNPIFKDRGQHLNIELTGLIPNQTAEFQVINMQGVVFHQASVQTSEQGNLYLSYSPSEDVPSGVYMIKIGNLRTRIVIR